MVKKILFFYTTMLLIEALFVSKGFTEDYTRWALPVGAKIRFGKGTINAMRYSPDGTRLVVGSSIGLWLYDAQAYQELSLIPTDSDAIAAMMFQGEGETLVTTDVYGTTHSWEIDISAERTGLLETKARRVYGEQFAVVAFSQDGTVLASGGQRGDIQLWDFRTGAHLLTMDKKQQVGITALAFSSDGKMLASSGGFDDEAIRLWDVATGEPLATLSGHRHAAFALAFSPDGRTLASGDFGGGLTFWDVKTGRELASSHGQTDAIRALAFSPDGAVIASGSWDGTLRAWSTDTGREVAHVTEHAPFVQEIALSPDGSMLASVSRNVNVRVWDTDTGHIDFTVPAHGGLIRFLEFSEDGSMLVCGDVGITLWGSDVASGRELFRYNLEGHTQSIWKTALAPDRRTLASGSYDTTIRLWDILTGDALFVLHEHQDGIGALAFSPDGTMLASGSRDETVRLWDTTTGEERRVFTGHKSEVAAVAFSPDGGTLASGSWDGTIHLWDIVDLGEKTENPNPIIIRQRTSALSVVFSPDGKTLVSGGMDGSIQLWNVDANRQLPVPPQGWLRGNFAGAAHPISTLRGHTGWIKNLEFSVDGGTLMSASWDGTVLFWDWQKNLVNDK